MFQNVKDNMQKFRIKAPIITIVCLPLRFRLAANSFKRGLCFLPTIAGKYRDFLNGADSIFESRDFPFKDVPAATGFCSRPNHLVRGLFSI